MTSPRGSNEYDWSQKPEPTSMARWTADHRTLTRVVVLVISAGLVAVLVTGLFTGDNHWYNYFQLPIWAFITVNFGWQMPKSVDDWRRQKLNSIE